jgi:hypothetical protein
VSPRRRHIVASFRRVRPQLRAVVALHASWRLFAWLHKDALIKRLDAEIDREADDAATLMHEVLQRQEADVLGDLLATERDESAVAWQALAQNLYVFHRSD